MRPPRPPRRRGARRTEAESIVGVVSASPRPGGPLSRPPRTSSLSRSSLCSCPGCGAGCRYAGRRRPGRDACRPPRRPQCPRRVERMHEDSTDLAVSPASRTSTSCTASKAPRGREHVRVPDGPRREAPGRWTTEVDGALSEATLGRGGGGFGWRQAGRGPSTSSEDRPIRTTTPAATWAVITAWASRRPRRSAPRRGLTGPGCIERLLGAERRLLIWKAPASRRSRGTGPRRPWLMRSCCGFRQRVDDDQPSADLEVGLR